MSILDFFRPKTIVIERERAMLPSERSGSYGHDYKNRTKYGNIAYSDTGYTNYQQLRENGRGVYHDSLIARGIVGRLVDNVINTGLTWESSPLWSLIPGAPESEDERVAWTENVENRFKLYTYSKEADVRGRLTLPQIERLLYTLRVKEGEYFGVLRYLNSPDRMSPVAIQILNNDQIEQPYDGVTVQAIKDKGSTVEDGIEYDAVGKMTAIYVREELGSRPKRIPVFGDKSKRRFVIHDGNFESADQFRGFPELSAMVYELDRLTEYSINELEATLADSLWFAAITADSNAKPKGPTFRPAGGGAIETSDNTGLKDGIQTVAIGKRALVMDKLPPGWKFEGWKPSRPNQNYAAFIDAHETYIAGALGMPLSVVRQKFQASYSAARAEILFFWNNVIRRRDDFISGFLDPLYESWFTENVRSRLIEAPGYLTLPVARNAWLYGTWDGISRPVVDPVKEVEAVRARQELGHTTAEREAKAYNGSDFRENVRRLTAENALLADANRPLNPEPAERAEDAETDLEDETKNGEGE